MTTRRAQRLAELERRSPPPPATLEERRSARQRALLRHCTVPELVALDRLAEANGDLLPADDPLVHAILASAAAKAAGGDIPSLVDEEPELVPNPLPPGLPPR